MHSSPSPMGLRRVQGFSLIELMVVATIIGISVIAFTPSFIFATADRRVASAASEVVRIGRRARAEAIGTQRAHLVWIRPGAGLETTGIVQLIRGTNPHCDLQNWQTLAAICPVNGIDPRACLENINLNDTHWFHEPFQIRLRSVPQDSENALVARLEGGTEANGFALCYQPSGATQWAVTTTLTDPMAFSDRNTAEAAGGAFMFVVGLFNKRNDAVEGTPRVLSYPLGTTPRRLR